jgi:hypothetical protein
MRGSTGDWEAELYVTLRAGAPLLWIEAQEEPRALTAIERASAKLNRSVGLWSCTRGLHALRSAASDAKTAEPVAALEAFVRSEGRSTLVMLDPHPFTTQALFVRRLRECKSTLAAAGKSLLLLAPTACPQRELSDECAHVVVGAASPAELLAAIDDLDAAHGISATLRAQLIEAGRGLRLDAFALALRMAEARWGSIDPRALDELRAARARAIAAGALLEPIDPDSSLEQLGGLDTLKRWLELRTHAWLEEARSFGVSLPRGVFLTGVQGGGKSTCARAIAQRFGVPLLRLDVGRLFAGLVGASEANVRRALAQAEEAAPCVLWLDELGHAFSELGRGDSGTSARVFSTLLTWLQDHRAPVFVVATANDCSSLPPELLRKGRFDEVFFVDLPSRIERAEILRIHLARRDRDATRFDLDALSASTEGFSGAELEQCVVTALLLAFAARRALAQEDLERAAREIVPLAKTARESIDALRRWAEGRARPASAQRETHAGRVAL